MARLSGEDNNNNNNSNSINNKDAGADYKSYLKRIIYLNLLFYFIAYSSISYTLVLGHSLFLKKAGPEFIPVSFIVLNSLLVLFEIALLTLDKIPEFKVLVFALTAGTIYTILCNIYFFEYNNYLIYFFYFVFGYIFIILTLFGYLTYLNDLLPLRAQKKYMPYIHGASSLGAVISGFSLNFLLPVIMVSGVLNLVVVLNIIGLVLIFIIDHNYRKMKSKAALEPSAADEADKNKAAAESSSLSLPSSPSLDPAEEAGATGFMPEEGFVEAGSEDGVAVKMSLNEAPGGRSESAPEKGGPKKNDTLFQRLREVFIYAKNTDLAYYLIIITFIVNFKEAVIDFVFSSRLAEEFAGVDEMAAFSGTFRAVNMLVVMAAQFFILKPFLNNYSVAAAMLVMPFAVIPLSAVGLVFYFFSTVISLKFFYEISVKCFNRPAVGIFTNAIAGRKTQIFVFYEMSAYSSKILAGVVIYMLKPWFGTYYFIYLILISALIYYYYSSKLEPAYIGALESSLKAKTSEERIAAINRINYLPAAKAVEALAPLLKSDGFEERFNAVNKIAGFEGASRFLYEALDYQSDPRITATIISKLSTDPKTAAAISDAINGRGEAGFRLRLDALFNHENRRVRANLIEGFSNFLNDGGAAAISARLCSYLNDADYRIRSAAVISVLCLSEDTLEMKKAIDGLYDMSVSADHKARASAAFVMGRLKSRAFISALAGLVNDDEAGVRNYSAIALINIGGAGPEEILRGRLAGESDAKVMATIENGFKAMTNTGRTAIFNMLKNHSVEFRNRAAAIFKNIDIDENCQLAAKILLINSDEVKLELFKSISAHAGDLNFIKFIDLLISPKGALDFNEFENIALANKFKLETIYFELYGAIAPLLKNENSRFISNLIDICTAAINYKKSLSADAAINTVSQAAPQKIKSDIAGNDVNKKNAENNIALQREIDLSYINTSDLLDFIFECAAISSANYENVIKNFSSALSQDPAISSYAAELIETILDDEIAKKIVNLIEVYKDSL